MEPQEKLVCATADPRNQGQNQNIPEIPARKNLKLASPGLFSDFVNSGQAGPDKINLDLNLTEEEIRRLPVDIFTRKPDDQDTYGREMEELINGTESIKDLVASKSISEIQKELEGFGQNPMPMLIPNWNSSRLSQGDHLPGQSNPQIKIPSPSALVSTHISAQVPSHGNHLLPPVIPGSSLNFKTGSRLIKVSEVSNIQRLTNPEVQTDAQEHRAQIKILNPTKLNMKASQVHDNRVFSPKERISVARRPSGELPLRQFQVAGACSPNRVIRVASQPRYSNPSILGTSSQTLPEASNVTTNTLSGTSTNFSAISATEYLYPLNAKLQSAVSVPNPLFVNNTTQVSSSQPTTAHQQVMNPANIQQLVNQQTIQQRSDPSYLLHQSLVPSYQSTTMHHPNQPQTASLLTSQPQFPNQTNSIGVQQYIVQGRPPLPTPQSNMRVQTTPDNVKRIHVNSYQAAEGNFNVQGSPVPRSVHSVVLSSGFGGVGQLQEGLSSNVTHINGPSHYRVSTGNGQITPESGSFSVSQPLPTPINVRHIGDLGHPLSSSQPTRAPQPSSAVRPEAIRPLAGVQPQRLRIRGGMVRLPGGVRAPRIPGQENQRMGMVRGGPRPRMRSQGPGAAGRFPRPPGPPPTRPSLGIRPPIGSPAGAGIPRSPAPARHQSPRPPSHQNTPPPKPAKSPPSVIKIEDDEPEIIELIDEPPTPLKSATIDRLKAGGISVTRQAPPKIPKGLKLPPGWFIFKHMNTSMTLVV